MDVSLAVLLAAILGGLVGIAADRLAARWPEHEPGQEALSPGRTPHEPGRPMAGPAPSPRGLDWRTIVVAGAGALALAAVTARWSEPRDVLVLGVFVVALIVLLATDLDGMILPDVITYPLVGYAALLAVLGLNPVLADKSLGIPSAIGAAVLAPLLLAVSDRIFRGALGRGDLKLSVSLGLMAGIANLFLGFLVATLAFAGVVVVLLLTRRVALRTAIPFGPALIAAGIVAVVLR